MIRRYGDPAGRPSAYGQRGAIHALQQQVASIGTLSTAWFGDSADGDVTLPAGTTTLTRAMRYRNLVIPAGATVRFNGTGGGQFSAAGVILVSGTLSGDGLLEIDGHDASGSTGGAQQHDNFYVNAAGGGTGRTGAGDNAPGNAGSGGAGGDAGNGSPGVGGQGSIASEIDGWSGLAGIPAAILGLFGGYTNVGGGGGGGGGDGVNAGGGGGGGGSMMWVAAAKVAFTGILSARGGDAAPGQGGNTGGGGGGGGGTLYLLSAEPNGLLLPTLDVSGGTGANGHGTGTAGQDGGDGLAFTWVV